MEKEEQELLELNVELNLGIDPQSPHFDLKFAHAIDDHIVSYYRKLSEDRKKKIASGE